MFTKIDELMWKDAKFKKTHNESRLLFIYLLSSQHRNVLGLYNLPKYYIQGDLGYSSERVSKGLLELIENGFVTYDEESETILIHNFLKYNPLENPNQVKGALKAIKTIPKTQLFYNLVDIINTSDNKYLEQLKLGLEKHLKSNGFERVCQRVSKQEEEEEEVKEEVKEEESKPSWSEESDEYRLSLYLYNHMLKNNPEAKKPNFQYWCKHIDHMIRLDNRSLEGIKKIIEFSQKDSFWCSNILSTKKLRDKYDQLYIQMNKNGGGNQNGFNKGNSRKADYDREPEGYEGLAIDLSDLR